MGNGVLCIDAVFDGNVVEKNRTKFGYTSAFLTTRYVGPAKEPAGISCDAKIVPVSPAVLHLKQYCSLKECSKLVHMVFEPHLHAFVRGLFFSGK